MVGDRGWADRRAPRAVSADTPLKSWMPCSSPSPSREASSLQAAAARRHGGVAGAASPSAADERGEPSDPIGQLFRADRARSPRPSRSTERGCPGVHRSPPASPESFWRALASMRSSGEARDPAPSRRTTGEERLDAPPDGEPLRRGRSGPRVLSISIEERLAATGEFDCVWRPVPGWLAAEAPLPRVGARWRRRSLPGFRLRGGPGPPRARSRPRLARPRGRALRPLPAPPRRAPGRLRLRPLPPRWDRAGRPLLRGSRPPLSASQGRRGRRHRHPAQLLPPPAYRPASSPTRWSMRAGIEPR